MTRPRRASGGVGLLGLGFLMLAYGFFLAAQKSYSSRMGYLYG